MISSQAIGESAICEGDGVAERVVGTIDTVGEVVALVGKLSGGLTGNWSGSGREEVD